MWVFNESFEDILPPKSCTCWKCLPLFKWEHRIPTQACISDLRITSITIIYICHLAPRRTFWLHKTTDGSWRSMISIAFLRPSSRCQSQIENSREVRESYVTTSYWLSVKTSIGYRLFLRAPTKVHLYGVSNCWQDVFPFLRCIHQLPLYRLGTLTLFCRHCILQQALEEYRHLQVLNDPYEFLWSSP